MCTDKERLLSTYAETSSQFVLGLIELYRNQATSPAHEFRRMRTKVEKSQLGMESARREMDLHVADHKCG